MYCQRRNISFEQPDIETLNRWKRLYGCDHSKGVRAGIGLLRRLESHLSDGWVSLMLTKGNGEIMHLDYLRELVPSKND